MRAIVDGRIADQIESVGAIENPEHDQVRETFYVGKSGLKLRQDFQDALCVVFRAQALWDLLRIHIGAADVSDGLG